MSVDGRASLETCPLLIEEYTLLTRLQTGMSGRQQPLAGICKVANRHPDTKQALTKALEKLLEPSEAKQA